MVTEEIEAPDAKFLSRLDKEYFKQSVALNGEEKKWLSGECVSNWMNFTFSYLSLSAGRIKKFPIPKIWWTDTISETMRHAVFQFGLFEYFVGQWEWNAKKSKQKSDTFLTKFFSQIQRRLAQARL